MRLVMSCTGCAANVQMRRDPLEISVYYDQIGVASAARHLRRRRRRGGLSTVCFIRPHVACCVCIPPIRSVHSINLLLLPVFVQSAYSANSPRVLGLRKSRRHRLIRVWGVFWGHWLLYTELAATPVDQRQAITLTCGHFLLPSSLSHSPSPYSPFTTIVLTGFPLLCDSSQADAALILHHFYALLCYWLLIYVFYFHNNLDGTK